MKSRAICLAALSAALLLAGCSKGIDTNEAVKAGVIKDLAKKVDVDKMDVNVTAVTFHGQEADATVSFSPKGAAPGQSITMKYAMAREGDEWKIKGRSLDGHAAPTAAPGGEMPAGHPGMGGRGAGGDMSTIGPGGVPMPPAHPDSAPKQ